MERPREDADQDGSSFDWGRSDRGQLLAAVEGIRAVLRTAARAYEQSGARAVETPRVNPPVSGPADLDRLCETFNLTTFERDIVLLCLAMEIDPDFGELCRRAQPRAAFPYPTFGLALATLRDPDWEAVKPESPLRYWRLVQLESDAPLVNARLRLDEPFVHYLVDGSDPATGLERPDDPADARANERLVATDDALAREITLAWAGSPHQPPTVLLYGSDALSRRAIARGVARRLGIGLRFVAANTLPTSPDDLDQWLRVWERQTMLTEAILVLEWHVADQADSDPSQWAAFLQLIDTSDGLVITTSDERISILSPRVLGFSVSRPNIDEQRELWRSALELGDTQAPIDVDRLVSQFELSAPKIRSIAAASLALWSADQRRTELGQVVWDATRRQARAPQDDMIRCVQPRATWADLVVAEETARLLRQIESQARQRARVYGSWGFARKPGGLGLTCLFHGPSGTGKTLGAEVLANNLSIDLLHVDLSGVVSKYIGDTAKHLRRVFDIAEESGAVLLFDEADALFGKRSDVRDSHDRYSNTEVSYLLQRMEAYRGVAILTTNLKSTLDAAFMRRLRFIVEFPFPDARRREELWKRVFPAESPTQELDTRKLAQLTVTGGSIRNIALRAAFLAAEANEPVRMAHVLAAARDEFSQLERPLSPSDTAGWV